MQNKLNLLYLKKSTNQLTFMCGTLALYENVILLYKTLSFSVPSVKLHKICLETLLTFITEQLYLGANPGFLVEKGANIQIFQIFPKNINEIKKILFMGGTHAGGALIGSAIGIFEPVHLNCNLQRLTQIE